MAARADLLVLTVVSACSASSVTEPDARSPDVASPLDGTALPDWVADPAMLEFGRVPLGNTLSLTIAFRNSGARAQTVDSIRLGQGDVFSISHIAVPDATGACAPGAAAPPRDLPTEVPPGGGLCVLVTFASTSLAESIDFVTVASAPSANGDPLVVAMVRGAGVAPDLRVAPARLDFGEVVQGEWAERSLTLTNEGLSDLVLGSLDKQDSGHALWPDVTIVNALAPGVVVPPYGDEPSPRVVTVRFHPTQAHTPTLGPLGQIAIASNDPDSPVVLVPVYANVGQPVLKVTPPDTLDFGTVASGKSATRGVYFTNTGVADLSVTGVALVDPAGAEFALLDALEDPLVIAPGEYRLLSLRFTNHGGPEGEVVNGTLKFASNDAFGGTSVALRAERTDEAECKLALDPPALEFGAVGYGAEKAATVTITNVGSSGCSPFKVAVVDGTSESTDAPLTCSAPVALSNSSNNFAVLNEPPAIKDFLQPGQTLDLQVKFTPQADVFTSAFSFGELLPVAALIQVVMFDYANLDTDGNPTEVRVPDVVGGEPASCNLAGTTGPSYIAALPGNVAFDTTTIGCFSKTETIKVYNYGLAPVHVCSIAFSGSCPEFKLKNVPPIPACTGSGGGKELLPGTPLEFGVAYGPENTGADGCVISVLSDQPVLTIPLTGSGTHDTHQTDVFAQLSGKKVDVLFVVDNSGSMAEEQENLASNISAFVAGAAEWQADFHIGVVSTDGYDSNEHAGELLTDGGKQPRFFTTQGGVAGFASTVKSMGVSGAGTEQGLEAGKRALTQPLTVEKGASPTSCTADGQCLSPLRCTPSVLEPGQSYCMGWNAEFLRGDAVLVVVFVSDEEDQSTGSLVFYEGFFRSIKGFANTDLFRAHAIVGDSPGGCTSADGDAGAGERYIDLVSLVGGKVKSICASNWAPTLDELGAAAFGPQLQFFLTRPAVVGTLSVTVADKSCATGWSYLPETNSILIDPAGPCMPQPNEEIVVGYDAACFGP